MSMRKMVLMYESLKFIQSEIEDEIAELKESIINDTEGRNIPGVVVVGQERTTVKWKEEFEKFIIKNHSIAYWNSLVKDLPKTVTYYDSIKSNLMTKENKEESGNIFNELITNVKNKFNIKD